MRMGNMKHTKGILFILCCFLFIQMGFISYAADTENWQEVFLKENGVVLNFPPEWQVYVNGEYDSPEQYEECGLDEKTITDSFKSTDAQLIAISVDAEKSSYDMLTICIDEANADQEDFEDMTEELKESYYKGYVFGMNKTKTDRYAVFREYYQNEDENEIYMVYDIYYEDNDEQAMIIYNTICNGQNIVIYAESSEPYNEKDDYFDSIVAEIDVLQTDSSIFYMMGYLSTMCCCLSIVIVIIIIIVIAIVKSNKKK